MKRNAIVLLAVLILAGFAVYQNSSANDKEYAADTAVPTETAPKPNFLAPGFTLTGLDGQTYEVGGKRDKPLFLNFWASWCGPCELEAPDLKKMYDKYGDKFDLYAVNITKNDRLDDAKDFVKQFDFKFPVLLDKDGKVTEMYRFQYIPTTFLIDRNGAVREIIHVLEPKELERKIKKLIES
ncbi:TlpA family protein disulfide reductase [Paenibacillus contaminans]|jgi:thiol-disulfide isomerase/thioredoxin|uniref:TlpA family protein disulfide reductase n=1 Tax=Paenibacillus contaminans TaxID=450362 RepID=A0A329LPR5_9BACL|nr:TlpA disulfide reductase family protein [Paenibacillus contaminans]RAV09498.1 TlpA family protein disulfide reductase [Paenibacillus contaminans]